MSANDYDPYAWDWELPYLLAAALTADPLSDIYQPPPPAAIPDPIIDTYQAPVVAIPDPIIDNTYEVNPMTDALMMNANTGARRQVGNIGDALNLLKTRQWSLYNPDTMREVVIAVAPMSGVYPHLVYDTARWDIDNMIMVDSGTPSIANGYVGDRMTLRDWWEHLQHPNVPPPPPILAFDDMPPAPLIDPTYSPFTDPFIHPELLPPVNTNIPDLPSSTRFPARVVVEGKGRIVYSQQELDEALAAGGYLGDLPPAAIAPTNTPLWLQIIQQTDQAYANGRLTSSMLQTALNVLRSVPPPYPPVVDEKISAWQFTLDNNLLGDQLPPVNPGVAEPDWLLVIRNMDQANAEGRLTSAMLRTGIGTLKQTPAPVPELVTEKIGEWQYTIDNNLLGDVPQPPGPVPTLPPLPGTTTSSPSLVTFGLVALAALFLLRK